MPYTFRQFLQEQHPESSVKDKSNDDPSKKSSDDSDDDEKVSVVINPDVVEVRDKRLAEHRKSPDSV